MALPAKIDDPEVAELRRRLVSLPMERQAQVLEGLLTPGLRLRVLAEQVRHQVGQMTDDGEAVAERELDDAVRGSASRLPVAAKAVLDTQVVVPGLLSGLH